MLNLDTFTVLTFDCYGTLIDWESGISATLSPIFAKHGVALSHEAALELFGELESTIESGPYRSYRQVLRDVLHGIGARVGFTPTPIEVENFAASVKAWPAFPDSARALQALKRKYKLVIVSNIDDDLFALSAPKLQVVFDGIITAQQVQSYKPTLNHFQRVFERMGVPRQQILHVAQSLYHDIAPAQSLGLATVWVNRRQGKAGAGATPAAQAKPDLVVPDLQTLAQQMGLM